MFNEIESEKKYVDFFIDTIKEFGGMYRDNPKYVLRKNINPFPEKGAYFGCIGENEEPAGAFSDLSIVVFPSNEGNSTDDRWIVALGVGTSGFKNDSDLVTLPGTRRLFVNGLGKESFIKDSFNIESDDGFNSFCEKKEIPETLKKAVKSYSKLLLVCSVIDPNNSDESKRAIKTFLAIYAKLRSWPSNQNQRKNVADAIKGATPAYNETEEKNKIKKLLEKRKYIVLQGAPGTGKTRMAKELVKEAENGNVFFTQFHAETTYNDFIYGIVPTLNSADLRYEATKGVFVRAIDKAKEAQGKKVYLVIDEINRANLSNVLGTAFYLFEPSMSGSNIKIEVCPGLLLDKLPDNLYVIATMNTADRSLSVVDFALRRRFAWYTMYPHKISVGEGMKFCDDYFNAIAEIFAKYATDEELNLQPGQAYFIVPGQETEEAMKEAIIDRMKYEVMPLIKEYLANGMLIRAKDDFVDYFRKTLDVEMYQ